MADGQKWRVETRTRASAIALPLVLVLVALLFAAPFFLPRSFVQEMFMAIAMLVMAQCWNLLAGYAGLVSVGQQAFAGLGAYVMFACVVLVGLDPIVAILAGGIAAAALSVPAAQFLFRLHGAYFAIGSWVIAEVVRLLIAQWKALGGGTGTSLPKSAIRDMGIIDPIRTLFGVKTGEAGDIMTYWLALVLALLTVGFAYRLLRTKQGLGLSAMRDNFEAARSVGVDSRRMKLIVYVATAFVTGLAGALIYVQKARISPDAAFSVTDWTAYVIFIVVIGGIGTLEGPFIGIIVFYVLQNLFADYGSWYLLVLGVIGIVIMLFAPAGLWGLFTRSTGIEIFPIRRRLALGPKHRNIKEETNG